MIVYTVKKGDTLWKIARQYQVDLNTLIAANPEINDPNYISVGQQINIPEVWTEQPGDSNPSAGNSMQLPSCTEDPSIRPCIYTTHEGDTLAQIAQIFMVPLSRLLYYNLRFSKYERLEEGTRIIIPDVEISPLPTHEQQAPNMDAGMEGNTIGRPPRKTSSRRPIRMR